MKSNKGLRVDVNPSTGVTTLTYYYPISKNDVSHYRDMAIANTYVTTFTNKKNAKVSFVVLILQGSSVPVFDQFRMIQNLLMRTSLQLKQKRISEKIVKLEAY